MDSRAAAVNIEQAYRYAATKSRDDLELLTHEASGVPQKVLKAVVAQYDGNVDTAIAILRSIIRVVKDPLSRAVAADLLAPILISRHEWSRVNSLIDVLENGSQNTSAASFRALVAAHDGHKSLADRHAAVALKLLENDDDVLLRARILHRLSLSAFYLHQYENAAQRALSSAAISMKLTAWRAASASFSILYSIQYEVTGDLAEADRFVRLYRATSAQSGDLSFFFGALVAEFALSVQIADTDRIGKLADEIKSSSLPRQYHERFPMALSFALVKGPEDLVAMRTLLQILRNTPERTRGEWSLCTALMSLSYLAELDDRQARVEIQQAVSRLGRYLKREPAYEHRYRRLSRAIAAAASCIVGDEALASRIIAVREMASDGSAQQLPLLVRQSKLQQVALSLRGVARVISAAEQVRLQNSSPAGLTSAEFEVLKMLARGWSAGRIATETSRSVHTVYSHTRSILSKLEATRSAEAVAIARSRGIIA